MKKALLTSAAVSLIAQAAAFASPYATTLERAKLSLTAKRAHVTQLRQEFNQLKDDLDGAASSRAVSAVFFVPSLLATAVGGVLISVSRAPGSGNGADSLKFGARMIGYPLVITAGTTTLITGYKVVVRHELVGKLKAKLAKFGAELDVLAEQIKQDEFALAHINYKICVQQDSANEEACDNARMADLNAASNR